MLNTEDLVLKILDYVGTDQHNCLFKRVNTSFNRVITLHRKSSSLSDLRNFCSSLPLFQWAMTDGGCPAQFCRKMAIHYAAFKGCIEVMEWCRNQNPPFEWDERCCMNAASSGQLSSLQWLRSQKIPCPWNTVMLVDAAVAGRRIAVIEWLVGEDVISDDEFREMISLMFMHLAGEWRDEDASLGPIVVEMEKRLARAAAEGVEIDPDSKQDQDDFDAVLGGGLQTLTGCVYDTEGHLSRADMAKILALLGKTVSNPLCSSFIMDLVMQTLSAAICYRPALIQKMNLVPQMIQESATALGHTDRKVYSISEDDKVPEKKDYPDQFAYIRLELLATRLPLGVLMSHVKMVLARCFSSGDSRDRKGGCCLISAMSESCKDGFMIELPTMVPHLTACAKDDQCLEVRLTALFSLQQLCQHCQPIILHYHEVILETVLERLQSEDGNDAAYLGSCVIYHLCENLDPPALAPYLHALVNQLQLIWKTYDSIHTMKECILALGTVAVGSKHLFWPFVEVCLCFCHKAPTYINLFMCM